MAAVLDNGSKRNELNQPQSYGDQIVITDQEFYQLRDYIHAHTGIDLQEHKRTLVCSRLAKRLRHHQIKSYGEYYDLLINHDPKGYEAIQMINAITTNKTEFFREKHHFDYLLQSILPQIEDAFINTHDRKIRIWSAGTSTGEEAYSLAMILSDYFSNRKGWNNKILATDIDTNVLTHAKRGVYNITQAKSIPEKFLARYFYKGIRTNKDCMLVKSTLRNIIDFKKLNLHAETWPMSGQFDVIFCRNVIIYFNKNTQKRLIERFTRYLKPGGYLMLGHSESLHGIHSGFKHIGHSIYQNTGE